MYIKGKEKKEKQEPAPNQLLRRTSVALTLKTNVELRVTSAHKLPAAGAAMNLIYQEHIRCFISISFPYRVHGAECPKPSLVWRTRNITQELIQAGECVYGEGHHFHVALWRSLAVGTIGGGRSAAAGSAGVLLLARKCVVQEEL